MRNAKIDKNQNQIVNALREFGASVTSLASAGNGVPDIVVGYNYKNYLMEIKGPNGTLTPAQIIWHENWKGTVYVVRTAEEAISILRGDFPI
jgi:hypothetical protein